MRLTIFILLCTVVLSACGQKGPLRLPDDATPKPPVVNTSTQTPAPLTK